MAAPALSIVKLAENDRTVLLRANIAEGGDAEITNYVLADIDDYADSVGPAAVALSINRIWWSLENMNIELKFEADTPIKALTLSGNGSYDFENIYGIKNPGGSGTTGSILLDTYGIVINAAAGTVGSLIIELWKVRAGESGGELDTAATSSLFTPEVAEVSGGIIVGGNPAASGYIRFLEDTDNGTNYITVTAPASLAANYVLTLPSATGTILTTADIGVTVEAHDSDLDYLATNVHAETATEAAYIDFLEATNNGTNKITLTIPDSVSSNISITLPGTTGTSGQALVTDGAGVTSWETISSISNSDILNKYYLTEGFFGIPKKVFPTTTTRAYYFNAISHTSAVFSSDNATFYKYIGIFQNGNSGTTALTMAFSNDGETWTNEQLITGLSNTPAHSAMVFDGINLHIWYWTSATNYLMSDVRHAISTPSTCHQFSSDAATTEVTVGQVLTGVSGVGYRRGTYGISSIFFNASATNSGSNPKDYTFYGLLGVTSGSTEDCILVYSTDGLAFTRWEGRGDTALIPRVANTFYSTYLNTVSLIKDENLNKYIAYFQGSSATPGNQNIGLAYTTDLLDIFTVIPYPLYTKGSDKIEYAERCYVPFPLLNSDGELLLYKTGKGSGESYATYISKESSKEVLQSTNRITSTTLGLVIGTDVQAYDAGLASIAGLTTAADKMIYTTASDTYAAIDLTAAGRAILDDATASDQRTTLGLAIGTNVQAYDAKLTDIAVNYTKATTTVGSNISLVEGTDNGTNKITLQAPASLVADVTLTLPTTDGDANQVLKTDGSGTLSWATPSSGLTEYTSASASGPSSLYFAEDTDNGTNKVTVQAPATLASDFVVTLPAATGTLLTDQDIGATVQAYDADLTDLAANYTKASASGAASLSLYEDTDDGTNKVTITVPALAGDYTLTLPTTDGDVNQVLKTDGSGNLSWVTPSSGLTEYTSASASGPSSLYFAEDTDNGTNKVTIQAPATLSADYTLTLPANDGDANQFLQTDGSGVLTWAAGGSGDTLTTGTWTPEYESDGDETITYDGTTAGIWMKIGRMVYVSGKCMTDSWSGAGGSYVYLKGLPYAIDNNFTVGSFVSWNWTTVRPDIIQGTPGDSTTKLYLLNNNGTNYAYLTGSNITNDINSNVMIFSFVYRTAS